MVKQILLLSGVVAMGLSAFAANNPLKSSAGTVNTERIQNLRLKDIPVRDMQRNDGSKAVAVPSKAGAGKVQWKRPAGQFWGTGLNADNGEVNYYFTPLVLRPWVDYTFENISTATGTPSWECAYINVEGDTQKADVFKTDDEDVTMSYIWYETSQVPLLSYKSNSAYAVQYFMDEPTGQTINVAAVSDVADVFGAPMPLNSHYWGLFTRHDNGKSIGFASYGGATPYEGMDRGWWFGTNNSGINAAATRFEKPSEPYLLNCAYFYYQADGNLTNDIPLKAYVFKTVNDAAIYKTSSGHELEGAELGELLAISESFIPKGVYNEDHYAGVVKFEFFDKDPVTGAQTAYSLEVEDDITIVVTGFNVNNGGASVMTCMSLDEYDEGYGNLGFLGSLNVDAEGNLSYGLTALKNFFNEPMPNSTLGIMAGITYPWLKNGLKDPQSVVVLPNEGETTATVQGLQYNLPILSTSMTDDYEITFNGEEECDWLSVYYADDEMGTDPATDEEYYTGFSVVGFEAEPNPNDTYRECKVKISIPAASYEITFKQGDDNAVGVVVADGEAQYYDLAGRRVMNPDKGIYIKKAGNKAEKVVL